MSAPDTPGSSADPSAETLVQRVRAEGLAVLAWPMERHSRAFMTAIMFLTRVPLPWGQSAAPAELRAALKDAPLYFPAVGMAIGFTTAITAVVLSMFFPLPIAILLALAVEACLTGAFHEDAVADFWDAFGGGTTRETTLAILKDSRLGSYGMLALLIAFLLRLLCLQAMPLAVVFWALVASATTGRWAILWAMCLLPPIPDRESTARDIGERFDWIRLLLVSPFLLVLLPLAVMRPTLLIVLPGLVAGIVFGLVAWQQRRLGGVVGDGLGTICYFCQIAVLLAALVGAATNPKLPPGPTEIKTPVAPVSSGTKG